MNESNKTIIARINELKDMPAYYGFSKEQTEMLEKRIAELKEQLS